MLLCIGCLAARPAAALDAAVNVRGDREQGRAGAEAYDQRSVRSEASLDQRLQLEIPVSLLLHYGALREQFWSEIGALSSSFEAVTQQPGLALSMRSGGIRVGLTGNGFRKDYYGEGFDGRRDERLDYGGYGAFDRATYRLQARWRRTDAWRRDPAAGDDHTRENDLEAGGRVALPHGGDVTYDYTENDNRNLTLGYRSLFRAHSLELRTADRFAADRGRYALQVRSQRSDQRLETGANAGRVYLQPQVGGYLLDDTPETHDPLESALTEVPALYDNNRTAATTINLGDTAPAVREYGGDYRNIQYDFGAPRDLSAAELYVDRILQFPQFWRWRVFVTSDPQASAWTELGPEAVTVTYREWDSSLRGWEVVFAAPVNARFFKLVDVKLGPTVPDLYVTELEVYGPSAGAATTTETSFWRHRVDGEAAYDVRPDLNVRYDLTLDLRRYDSGGEDLTGATHQLTSRWQRGIWAVTGTGEIHSLRSGGQPQTRLNSQLLSVSRGVGGPLLATLSWNRIADHSADLDKTTSTWAIDASWEIAPALRWLQKASYGRLDDEALQLRSRAWVIMTGLHGSPVPSLTIDLRDEQRWVDQQAGTGFTRFGDTQSIVHWTPLPLVSIDSEVHYQVRDRADWVLRHLVTWNLLPGGSLEPQLTATDYRDTRTDTYQRGGGIAMTWRPRPRLFLAAGIEKTYFSHLGDRSWPVNSHAEANWTF